ncbi:DNA-processing protein DprA [Bombilactobacillus folatiphilus]|uniref:DNA-processing protein DprA n=1 Tax=Bombilactobacillus folatiphilus TaxID=2923362 RepID=A0ABY4PAL7_9LACO|nr:DNA-processing protein DprA [Bombilactobacillus folatiphilus]UQS82790.1 DNA-processing protein DprA [Bombilactobacillus folatiphilus]
MSLRTFLYQLSKTRCVSNQLLLKVCQLAVEEKMNIEQLFHYVRSQLKDQQRILFDQVFNQDTSQVPAMITFLDSVYPQKLREIYNPPAILYYQGNLQLLQKTTVAIVGARQSNRYTQTVVRSLVPTLVRQDIVTVSGLAQGADSWCHQVTLDENGQTIAVVGNSIDYYYPAQNQSLQQQVSKRGLLLSEYPPTTNPRKYFFPQRNRIIAGLCETLVVTQAKKRSGSLITAQLALQENRNVWAAPGPLDSSLSKGCNELIAAGARPYFSAQDLIDELRD